MNFLCAGLFTTSLPLCAAILTISLPILCSMLVDWLIPCVNHTESWLRSCRACFLYHRSSCSCQFPAQVWLLIGSFYCRTSLRHCWHRYPTNPFVSLLASLTTVNNLCGEWVFSAAPWCPTPLFLCSFYWPRYTTASSSIGTSWLGGLTPHLEPAMHWNQCSVSRTWRLLLSCRDPLLAT